ncbi:uncharacterized protein N7446_008002 [Penicillium canescens]|uniref:Uncharacterized protein n=1 Tax=Penicillium canescens TaxID=5083 RepID=A0AAD6NDK7_PENCN|nr:uncharacterized protein N7446_008002 [Penicillium canescens]KAJ6033704.1 hypothetical protein N7444_011475 [Penicillium canescens]KAJ6057103.1 hypothetical protein N7460_000377 [Penicillium canescens]KAJ6058419.1 hypothetical protein N7446_008002 [Penicillium canescens]
MENVSPAQGDQPKDVAEQTGQTTTAPVDVKPQTETKTETVIPKKEVDDDEDSDFDELDDVLDDFSKPKPAPAPAPAPVPSSTANPDESTGVAPANFDEDAFLKQLEAEMANMMGGGGAPPGAGAGAGNPADLQATVDQGADVFAKQLEESGIPPGDFLKQLLADVMAEEGGGGASAEGHAAAAAAAGLGGSGSGSGSGSAQGSKSSPASTELTDQPAESFNDAIKRTMGRMKESGDKATAAASSEDDISDDMLAQLLKAVEAGASGAGDEGDLSKMFMGMMEQLSNKEMLYEPMKELDGKFGPWLVKSKAEGQVSEEDMGRYETQAKVVKQIVGKFEESGYSDDDPKCREYVWERMQEMQAAGSPPEELVSNPLMEDLGGLGAGAAGVPGMPDCPQQ